MAPRGSLRRAGQKRLLPPSEAPPPGPGRPSAAASYRRRAIPGTDASPAPPRRRPGGKKTPGTAPPPPCWARGWEGRAEAAAQPGSSAGRSLTVGDHHGSDWASRSPAGGAGGRAGSALRAAAASPGTEEQEATPGAAVGTPERWLAAEPGPARPRRRLRRHQTTGPPTTSAAPRLRPPPIRVTTPRPIPDCPVSARRSGQ